MLDLRCRMGRKNYLTDPHTMRWRSIICPKSNLETKMATKRFGIRNAVGAPFTYVVDLKFLWVPTSPQKSSQSLHSALFRSKGRSQQITEPIDNGRLVRTWSDQSPSACNTPLRTLSWRRICQKAFLGCQLLQFRLATSE